jgi:hypothetical protein
MVRPVRFDVAKFLAFHLRGERLDLARVPEAYRLQVQQYLAHGVMPARPLRLLLEGNPEAIGLFRDDLPALLALSDWMHGELPCACWGSPDQVQSWLVFARRNALRIIDHREHGGAHG